MEYSRHKDGDPDARGSKSMMEKHAEAQREAIVLQHWHGYSLKKIAEHMDRTPVAVAGLLKRGLRRLRASMPDTP